jgi:hypothetical protein
MHDTPTQASPETETSVPKASCQSGSCLTGPRMCPGFALLGGWAVSMPVYYLSGSRDAAIVITVLVAAALVFGLHRRLWNWICKR